MRDLICQTEELLNLSFFPQQQVRQQLLLAGKSGQVPKGQTRDPSIQPACLQGRKETKDGRTDRQTDTAAENCSPSVQMSSQMLLSKLIEPLHYTFEEQLRDAATGLIM